MMATGQYNNLGEYIGGYEMLELSQSFPRRRCEFFTVLYTEA